ncbi:MAG: ATP-binding protein, partial [Pyrinomonadaceae bacterium]|nr:ATP-binding protein [Pyrinomonadaceae bacterium]
GDKTRIAQMLLNLLDNATKYTPVGGLVTIKANVNENYGTTNAIISITDNGSGIPKEFREAVFTRFYRLDESRTRKAGGSGLGLPIARQIAESHGGCLTLCEATNGGANFTVLLPVEFEIC